MQLMRSQQSPFAAHSIRSLAQWVVRQSSQALGGTPHSDGHWMAWQLSFSLHLPTTEASWAA